MEQRAHPYPSPERLQWTGRSGRIRASDLVQLRRLHQRRRRDEPRDGGRQRAVGHRYRRYRRVTAAVQGRFGCQPGAELQWLFELHRHSDPEPGRQFYDQRRLPDGCEPIRCLHHYRKRRCGRGQLRFPNVRHLRQQAGVRDVQRQHIHHHLKHRNASGGPVVLRCGHLQCDNRRHSFVSRRTANREHGADGIAASTRCIRCNYHRTHERRRVLRRRYFASLDLGKRAQQRGHLRPRRGIAAHDLYQRTGCGLRLHQRYGQCPCYGRCERRTDPLLG